MLLQACLPRTALIFHGFHFCRPVGISYKYANNGAKANFRRDYKTNQNADHDLIFTVTTGSVTVITTSAATYNLYQSELKNKGFRYAGKDEYGARYVYGKYMVYASADKKDNEGISNWGFTLDKK